MATAQVATRRPRQRPNLFDRLMKAFSAHGPSVEQSYRVKVYMQLSDGLNDAAETEASGFNIELPARDAFGPSQAQQVTQVISKCLSAQWGVVQVTQISCSTTYCWYIFKKRRAPRRRRQPSAKMKAAAKPPPNHKPLPR